MGKHKRLELIGYKIIGTAVTPKGELPIIDFFVKPESVEKSNLARNLCADWQLILEADVEIYGVYKNNGAVDDCVLYIQSSYFNPEECRTALTKQTT